MTESWMKATGAARCVVLAALVTVSGCAAKEAHFASKFVKPGEPTASYDDPTAKPAPPAQSLQDSAQTLATQVDAEVASDLIASRVTTQPVETVIAVLSALRDGASINAAAKASGIDYRTAQRIMDAATERPDHHLTAVG